MSFCIMVIIMLAASIIGGLVNYFLPGNNPEPKKFIKPPLQCILLGFGATLLVPLFLEIAQSKLMDDIRFDCKWTATVKDTTVATKDTVKIVAAIDSSGKKNTDTSILKGKPQKEGSTGSSNPGKNYLLWAAYCLLAAAAGFRFINMLIKNVVKEEEVKTLRTENKELTEEKQLEDQRNKLIAQVDEQKASKGLFSTKEYSMKNLPVIGPITVAEDPQKGRFGGQAEKNNRKLKASVKKSNVPGLYNISIWVESTDTEKHPLETDCIFYIHDSFRPSVYQVKPENGIAKDDEILSYGAFTVGVVTDNGETLLELDLSEDKDFPKEFRKR